MRYPDLVVIKELIGPVLNISVSLLVAKTMPLKLKINLEATLRMAKISPKNTQTTSHQIKVTVRRVGKLQTIKNFGFFSFRATAGPQRIGKLLQSTSEQHQTNFEKALKTTFSTLKMVRMTLSEAQILT